MQPILTHEIEAVLRRYIEIQAEERRLEEEKRGLQVRLFQHLKDSPGREWHVTVDDRRIKVTHAETTRITYDEKLLAERLGDRYLDILTVDPKKLREREQMVQSYLRPILVQIGTPDREKIRRAIETGICSTDDFRGAFVKTGKPLIAVSVSGGEQAGQAWRSDR
ncbi:MAG: hypothetical protein EHM18_01985 [Acidobacteria bacterium]|nr:MAG: hypothetical protein EHM18_01985 [Acidobacteriota bacterium]